MYRILVVDDEAIIANSVASYLEDCLEAEVAKSYSAFEALEILRSKRFDMVITDVSMPLMSGMELLDYIKEYWPLCRVVILTAHSEFAYAYATLRYDNVDYVLKVDGHEALRSKVERHLRRLEQERSKELLYISMGKRITLLTPHLRNNLIDNLLSSNEPLPADSLLDTLGLPLCRSRLLLLAVGLVEDECTISAELAGLCDYIERGLSLRGIRLVLHTDRGRLVWLMQPATLADVRDYIDIAVYVRELFGDLPDMLMEQSGKTLTFVTTSEFVSWESLSGMYSRLCDNLDRIRGTVGVKVLTEKAEDPSTGLQSTAMADEFGALWQMLRAGKQQQLFDRLEVHAGGLRQVADLREVLPLPVVSATELLLQQGAAYFNYQDSSLQTLLSQPYFGSPMGGDEWLNRCKELFEKLLLQRHEERKQNQSFLATTIRTYIQQNFQSELSLFSLSELVHYNPSYLSRIYKEQTGQSLVGYINEVRTNHARMLLETTTLRINEVAQQTGFCSVKYFNQVFRRAFGMSAGEHRDQQQQV